jgi:hypothetical protein
MITALVGIAAQTTSSSSSQVSSNRIHQSGRCSQVDGGCGYGPEQACECSDVAKERWIRQGCKEFHLETSS